MPRKLRLALIGTALAVASSGAMTISFAGVAHASGPSVTIPAGTFTDGETITVTGSGYPSRTDASTGLTILECADPGGTPAHDPIDDSTCDGSTASPLPVFTDSSGNFSASYQVSRLTTHGGASNINCDQVNPCVLWVGVDANNNFTDPTDTSISSSFLMTLAPSFTSANHATFVQGPKSTFTVAATSSPGAVITESGALPSGVTFTGGTGHATLSGATAKAGSFPIHFTANNGRDAPVTQNFTLTVTPATTFGIVAGTPPPATRGHAYSFQLQAVGPHTAPVKWKVVGLPKGLKVGKTTGLIAGTPKTAKSVHPGNYAVTATVKDHSKPAKTATQHFTITLH